MRKALSACAVTAILALAVGTASAQELTGVRPKYRPQPLNLHKESLGTVSMAREARARMRNGDCAGALDLFDRALATSIDPTLYRDRGLCHEQLRHPYPAMDDFRVYVSEVPDAADAENIRQRLARLEMDTYHRSSQPTDTPEQAGPAGPGAMSVGVSGGAGTKRDAMENVEHDHDEMQSPLRTGKGISLAPFFAERKWLVPGSSFGDSDTWSEAVGLQARFSFDAQNAFVLEAGYESFNATQGVNLSGFTSLVGYELRVPLDPAYDNQLLLGAGVGWEYLSLSADNGSISGATTWGFVPRLRLGWRHMITTSVGFDLSLDGGLTLKALSQSGGFLQGTGDASELIALQVGLVWGL
jgi:hypothetical protein